MTDIKTPAKDSKFKGNFLGKLFKNKGSDNVPELLRLTSKFESSINPSKGDIVILRYYVNGLPQMKSRAGVITKCNKNKFTYAFNELGIIKHIEMKVNFLEPNGYVCQKFITVE